MTPQAMNPFRVGVLASTFAYLTAVEAGLNVLLIVIVPFKLARAMYPVALVVLGVFQ